MAKLGDSMCYFWECEFLYQGSQDWPGEHSLCGPPCVHIGLRQNPIKFSEQGTFLCKCFPWAWKVRWNTIIAHSVSHLGTRQPGDSQMSKGKKYRSTISSSACKGLENCHSVLTVIKSWMDWKINNSSWNHKRGKDTYLILEIQLGNTGSHSLLEQRLLSGNCHGNQCQVEKPEL